MLVFSCNWRKLGGDMNAHVANLKNFLSEHYEAAEWPTLLEQTEQWQQTRPLAGLRILDATPVFHNTLAKYLALLAAGAELFIPARPAICDSAARQLALSFGIRAAGKNDTNFDIILDCAGQFNRLHPTLGFCELTRSGVARLERVHHPVFVADAGRIKRIETILGTGDGFFRALGKLGYGEVAGKSLVVVGYGKVGRGVVLHAQQRGMRVTVADVRDVRDELPSGIRYCGMDDPAELTKVMVSSWCVVTCSGRINALRRRVDASAVHNSDTLLANLGVEDEFGADISPERVLNRKIPLNFILEEPTAMRYIETTMALHNACALELLTADLPHRLMPPPADVEERLLHTAATRGNIGSELARLSSLN